MSNLTTYRNVEEDILYMLVRIAVKHEEITASRAAEILGIKLDEFRDSAIEWFHDSR